MDRSLAYSYPQNGGMSFFLAHKQSENLHTKNDLIFISEQRFLSENVLNYIWLKLFDFFTSLIEIVFYANKTFFLIKPMIYQRGN